MIIDTYRQRPEKIERYARRMEMDEIEDEMVAEKPWALKGEVKASQRPQNSLLEHYLDFQVGATPAVENSDQLLHNDEIEEMIKQRILDINYDHVHTLKKEVINKEHFSAEQLMSLSI